jgi:hypothetical protein
MVGGKIFDFFIKEDRNESFIVKFLVEDNTDYCTVMAEIPKDAIKFQMVKVGQDIWWHNPYVLIKIEETEDVKFKKVGFSGGSISSFLDEKRKTTTP